MSRFYNFPPEGMPSKAELAPLILFADLNYDCNLYLGTKKAMEHLRDKEGGAPYAVDPASCVKDDQDAIHFDLTVYGNVSRGCSAAIFYAPKHWYA